jgi:HEAT repeat protein
MAVSVSILRPFHQPADTIDSLARAGDLSGLIRHLSDPDESIRNRASDALGVSGPAALPLLAEALDSPAMQVRVGIVGAISRIHDPVAVPVIADLARTDPSIDVRWAALLALGTIGDPAGIPVCVEALRDNNRYVRYGSALALGRLLWEPADDAQWAYYFIALQDWDGLRSLGRAAAIPMQDMLRDDDPDVRMILIDILSQTGTPESMNACTELLKDRRDSVRYRTVLSAMKTGMAAERMPLLIVERERTGPNPAVAALLNFLFLGIGYNYIGKWWGFLVFMCFMSILVLAQLQLGPFLPYLIAYPVTALFAIQTYREAQLIVDG